MTATRIDLIRTNKFVFVWHLRNDFLRRSVPINSFPPEQTSSAFHFFIFYSHLNLISMYKHLIVSSWLLSNRNISAVFALHWRMNSFNF